MKAALADDAIAAGRHHVVPNDDDGIDRLVHRLRRVAPALVVLEATAGYERAVVGALAAAAIPLVVANPRQIRDFARATGQRAKTDAN